MEFNKFNSLDTIRYLIKRDSEEGEIKCFYCEHRFSHDYEGYNFMTVDHKIPQIKIKRDLSKYDHSLVDDPKNLVLSCRICNSSKGSKDIFFDYKNNEIIETNDLKVFKKRMLLGKDAYKRWVKECMFSALNDEVEEEWLDGRNYSILLKEQMENHGDKSIFSNVEIVKDGVKFTYKNNRGKFAFWTVNMGLYIRSRKTFSLHRNFFLCKGYSILSGTVFLGIHSPSKMICLMIEKLDEVLKHEKECLGCETNDN